MQVEGIMVMGIGELVSKIDEALFGSEDQHPHRELVRNAAKGPEWYRSPESGYRYLVYHIPHKKGERVGRIHAVYGATLRKISANLWKEIRSQGVPDFDSLLKICGDLLERWTSEYRVIAFDWCFRMIRYYEKRHYPTFEGWVKTYLTTWGSVDDFCTHTMGYFLYRYPEFAGKVKKWVESENPWVRRAAAVTFIYGLRRGVFLEHAFDVADALLTDEHRYVQWGYGWMLKEATKHFLDDVFAYVMRNKAVMPRPALRYAVEKMPKDFKTKAMGK
jgi:3-methyladenine DNA glycosylase AlkD